MTLDTEAPLQLTDDGPNNERANPRPVHHTPASSVSEATTGQTSGMIRQSAIVSLSPSICGTLMRAQAHGSSAVHHHGEQGS
jgi:hypothetical protein